MTTDNNSTRPYVLWRRVSTREQGDSKLGLKAQLAIAQHFMRREPAKIYTEVYSGTKLSECKQLWLAIEHCKRTGDLLVIAKTDRFRNVREALDVLETVGEGNLSFCDIPTTDKFVLTVIFAMWERQATMGRINTRLALAEREKERKKNGFWISNAGNVCTHFGNEKGCDVTPMVKAAAKAKAEQSAEWRVNSKAYNRAVRKKREGWTLMRIVADLSELYDENPEDYSTRSGARPSPGVVSRWIREANTLVI
jgi:DNA invertase Pin-like site-specific DNA recombinase